MEFRFFFLISCPIFFNCVSQDYHPIKQNISLYKQLRQYCRVGKHSESLDKLESDFFKELGPVLGQHGCPAKFYIDREDNFFANVLARNSQLCTAPEIVMQVQELKTRKLNLTNVDYCIFTHGYCDNYLKNKMSLDVNGQNTTINILKRYASGIIYMHVMRSLILAIGEKETCSFDICAIKKICACSHLNFFNIDLPIIHEYEQIRQSYRVSKQYIQWYNSSWFLWWFYAKPDQNAFNKLKMQYRYVK